MFDPWGMHNRKQDQDQHQLLQQCVCGRNNTRTHAMRESIRRTASKESGVLQTHTRPYNM